MPIRTGSGGLKYPLTNQAQIQAQQAAASASAGGSASASAFGDRMRLIGQNRQLRYNAYQSDLERGFRAEQSFFDREHQMGAQLNRQGFIAEESALDRGLRSGENQLDREFRAKQAELGRGFQADQAQLGRDFQSEQEDWNRLQDQEFTREQDAARFQRQQEQNERSIDAQYEQGIANGTLVIPASSQAKLDKMEAGMAELGKLDPKQQEEARPKFEAEKRRLLRTATRPGGPSPTGQFRQGVTYVDAQGRPFDEPGEGRTAYVKNGNGWERLENPEKEAKVRQGQMQQQAQMELQQKREDNIRKRYNENLKSDEYGNEDDAYAAAVKAEEAFERNSMNGRGQQAAPAQPGPAGGAAPPTVPNPGGWSNGPASPPIVQRGSAGGTPAPPSPGIPAHGNGQWGAAGAAQARQTLQGLGGASPQWTDANTGAAVSNSPPMEGLPEGATMLNANEIRMPDGTVKRRKSASVPAPAAPTTESIPGAMFGSALQGPLPLLYQQLVK